MQKSRAFASFVPDMGRAQGVCIEYARAWRKEAARNCAAYRIDVAQDFNCNASMNTIHPTSTATEPTDYRLLDIHAVRKKLCVGTTFIYTAPGFPKPIKVGRRSFWVEREIDAYVESRMAARG
jgi:predicted DNA-binding transcriptional regulator AlpA